MAKGDGVFWAAPPEKAACQIFGAIAKRKEHVYVTKRWRVIAWVLKAAPKRLYHRFWDPCNDELPPDGSLSAGLTTTHDEHI
jgi:hypothetical protein